MVVSEFAASVAHYNDMFKTSNIVARYTSAASGYAAASRDVNPNFEGVIDTLNSLQKWFIEYESIHGFPFDSNPLSALLNVQQYVGAGAIENLKTLLQQGSAQVGIVIQEAPALLANVRQRISQLSGALSPLPVYKEARSMFKVSEEKTVVRLVLPFENESLSAASDNMKNALSALQHLSKLDKVSGGYDYEVLAVAQASPQELLVVVNVKVALALNIIAKTLIKRWKEIEEVRYLRAQTENLKADTEQKRAAKEAALKGLESFGQKEEVNKDIAHDVVVMADEPEIDGSQAEVEMSVKQAVDFVENVISKGGSVNVYLKPSNDGELDAKWIESRSIQARIDAPKKLLGE